MGKCLYSYCISKENKIKPHNSQSNLHVTYVQSFDHQCRSIQWRTSKQIHPFQGIQLTFSPIFTLRSGMMNLLLQDRLALAVTVFILSQACIFALSPGAEINQNSDMVYVEPFTLNHCSQEGKQFPQSVGKGNLRCFKLMFSQRQKKH